MSARLLAGWLCGAAVSCHLASTHEEEKKKRDNLKWEKKHSAEKRAGEGCTVSFLSENTTVL